MYGELRPLKGAGGKPGENLVEEYQAGGKSTHVHCVRGSVRTRGPVLWPQASKQQGDTGRDEGWMNGRIQDDAESHELLKGF